jgi:hypothetical protein
MPTPLGSCTWVPANSFNYIDIYAAAQTNTHGETPGRVLESGKLLRQQKVVLDAHKKKKKKKKANHYDELCLQYQYAQEWHAKRNCEVSVKLTKTELKVFNNYIVIVNYSLSLLSSISSFHSIFYCRYLSSGLIRA